MTFKEAQKFVMPFGKHKDSTLDDIASDDEGLRYLDWISGEYKHGGLLRAALNAYLGDPAIKKELEEI